jgi:hypothetical protein
MAAGLIMAAGFLALAGGGTDRRAARGHQDRYRQPGPGIMRKS